MKLIAFLNRSISKHNFEAFPPRKDLRKGGRNIHWLSFFKIKTSLLLKYSKLRSAKLQHTNSSPISNCRRSKSAIYINSLLRLRVGMHIIYIYIYIGEALHTGSQNENNIGAAAPCTRITWASFLGS